MRGKLEDSQYTLTIGWEFLKKLAAAAEMAGCTTGEVIVRALGLYVTILKTAGDDDRLAVIHGDDAETEITNFRGPYINPDTSPVTKDQHP